MIKAVLFDFGGVLADEGFREGLKAITKKNGLDPEEFYAFARELIYKTRYVVGMCDEHEYWESIRLKTGISGNDHELRNEILKRFGLRPEMLNYVNKTKAMGFVNAILSDQTNWLGEINQKSPFFYLFDHIFNSFKLHKGKRDPSIFSDVCTVMDLKPEEVLFIDNNIGNINRAQDEDLKVLHFTGFEYFEKEIENLK